MTTLFHLEEIETEHTRRTLRVYIFWWLNNSKLLPSFLFKGLNNLLLCRNFSLVFDLICDWPRFHSAKNILAHSVEYKFSMTSASLSPFVHRRWIGLCSHSAYEFFVSFQQLSAAVRRVGDRDTRVLFTLDISYLMLRFGRKKREVKRRETCGWTDGWEATATKWEKYTLRDFGIGKEGPKLSHYVSPACAAACTYGEATALPTMSRRTHVYISTGGIKGNVRAVRISDFDGKPLSQPGVRANE